MEKTLKEISDIVGGEVIGDSNTMIKGVMTITEAIEGYITFLSNKRYEKWLKDTRASAIIVSPDHIHSTNKPLLVTKNPYLAFAKVVDLLMNPKKEYPGTIDPQARIDKSAHLGKDITIYHNVSVGANTRIDDHVVLYPGVYIGEDCEIGSFTVIHPNAVIYKGSKIGKRVTIHSNAVIGSPGFGYAPDEKGFYKIPHVGITVIEDDVDIEPNTTISCAALGETRIKRGTKIGCFVAIAHNTEIGENTLIVSQSGVAGSTKIGNNVTIGGQVGVAGHLKIGDNVKIGGKSGVVNDLPPNSTYLGSPAIPIERMHKCSAAIKRLPEMREAIRSLKKRVEVLEKIYETGDKQ